MKCSRRSVLAAMAVALVSCGGAPVQLEARPGSFPKEVLAGRRSAGSVALVNAQATNLPVSVGATDTGRPLMGNLSQWTDVAIQVLAEKLKDSGMAVTDTSSRRLRLAITKADVGVTGGGFASKCAVTIHVESSDGLNATFVGERASMLYKRVCDAGIAEAVGNMLRDERVLGYLGF